MPKPLTESQAWAYLAKKWDGAVRGRFGVWHVPLGKDGWSLSITFLAWNLYDERRISREVFDAIEGVMHERDAKGTLKHHWTCTASGARARAAFCRKMAAQTKRRKG